MRRIMWIACLALCACGFMFSVAAMAQENSVAAPNFLGPTAMNQSSADSSLGEDSSLLLGLMGDDSCKHGCHDCLYKYFPGVVNYCLGLHDWNNGSYKKGMEYFKSAAGWGNKKSQYALGLIYYSGRHVAVDQARGIAWLMLANERHNDAQTERLTRSAIHLATAAQYQRAQQLFEEMRKQYGDKAAGVRAWHHLRNGMNVLDEANGNSPKTACIQENGGVVPWSPDIASDPDVLCMTPGPLRTAVAKIATTYFKRVTGTVTVGPLQQGPTPAASGSTH